MSAEGTADGLVYRVLQRRGLRQFAKFCIVGASSTTIDFLVFYTLIELVHIQKHLVSQDAARSVAVLAAFLVAVTNGFYWNSRWTFRQGEAAAAPASEDAPADQPVHESPQEAPKAGRAQRQYAKFLVTNVIGLCLNITLTLVLARLAPAPVVALLRGFLHKDPAAFFGKAIATTVVVFWNFTASKYWAFKS